MAESSLASSRRQLAGMLDRCEDLLGQLNRREELLSEMRSLGDRIDEAYAAFESSPQAEADRLLLGQTQAKLQASIESLRLEADAILAEWWDYHMAVGEALVEMAQHAPAALSAHFLTPMLAGLTESLWGTASGRQTCLNRLRIGLPPQPSYGFSSQIISPPSTR